MNRDDWLQRVATVRKWSRRGERAPHKPLLLLYAIGRVQRTGSSLVTYAEAESPLQSLLDEFGPAGRTTSPSYPFHHLQTDGLWVVTTADGRPADTSVRRLRAGASGRLAPDFEKALQRDPGLAALAIRLLLDNEFPESLHDDICAAAGVDVEAYEVAAATGRLAAVAVEQRRRSTTFRVDVLEAYEYRCAVCGYDGRLGTESVALDAAHVRWWAFNGPDELDNALCLCVLHHKLFDRGAIGVTAEHTVVVSRKFYGHASASKDYVVALGGRDLLPPQPGLPIPRDEHVSWHTEQVFQGPARTSVPA